MNPESLREFKMGKFGEKFQDTIKKRRFKNTGSVPTSESSGVHDCYHQIIRLMV